MSTPSGGLVGDAHINVNANTTAARGELDRLARHADGRLRDMRGRFTSESRLIGTAFNRAAGGGGAFSSALEKLKGSALSLAPALIPIAVQAAPIAASVGAAGAAIGVFAAAAGGQVAALTEAGEAEKKYQDAMAEHGRTSKQAIDAQAAYVRSVKDMPPATREAAAGLSSFKDQYKSWSDSLAGDTMPVATKAFATFGAVFPKLTPIVQGAGVQLNRFMTIAAGGVASPAFDRFMQSFAEFSTGALQRGNEHLIRFMRTLNTGKVSGGFSTFMDYVRENGPIVREMLSSVMQALANMAQAAANVGPGLLTVVNVIAKLVAALPPDVITHMLQLALALKAVRLAAAAAAATSVGIASFTASIAAMRLAAGGATGVLPRLGAAIATLSRTAKVAIAGTGIGLLLIALTELSQRGRAAPPDVDKLTGSLARLGKTGKTTGEAAKAFGSDLDGLYGKVKSLTDPSTTDNVQQFLVGWTGWDSTPVKEAKENLGAVDSALANLVKNNQADLAAAAVKRLTAEYGAGGRNTKEFTSRLDEYKGALADAKFEQQLAADAMGLFGAQAQQTSTKLAEQKASADGLRQAIQALNDVQRAGLGGMIGFEASIDAATKAARENAGVLSMQGGQLTLNTDKQRAAATALTDLASKTDEAAAANRESTGSWAGAIGIYERGRQQLIQNAVAMGLNTTEAKTLADQILNTPDKTAMLKADITDWKAKVSEADKQLKTAKGDKRAKLTADAADWKVKVAEAERQLLGAKASKQAKLTADISVWKARVSQAEVQLKTAKGEKKAKLTADISDWKKKIGAAQAQINGLPASKTTTLTINRVTRFTTVNATSKVPIARRDYATGGPIGFPGGGPIRGPGTGTSDSIPIMASDGEYMINARSTAKHLALIEAINADRLGAGTGMGGAGAAVAQGLAGGMTSSASLVLTGARQMAAAVTAGVRAELQISSPSKVMQALAKDIGAGLIKGLTGTREQISRTAADIASSITKAFSGRKTRIDDQLVAVVAYANKRLQVLAAERDRIAQRIADAKKFSADVASQAKGAFSLQSLTQGSEGVSGETIRRGLAAAAGQIREFIGRINVLRKKGLSKDLLAQIIGMGPEAGLEFANVLSRQSTESLREINRLQGQINKASTDLGKLSADALFDAGKESGRGFLAGLAGQRKQIEQLMLSIAKSMQAALRKALDINSPSGVMAEVGRQSTLGVAVGLVDQLPAVKKAMGGIARTVSAGIAAPGLPISLSAGSRSGTAQQAPLNVTFINHGPIGSQREMDDWLVGSMDRLRLQRRLPKVA
jgi:trimeric autotransporter adhesin